MELLPAGVAGREATAKPMEGDRVPCCKPAGSLSSRDSEPCLCLAASPRASLCGDSGAAHQHPLTPLPVARKQGWLHELLTLAGAQSPFTTLLLPS